MQEETKYAKAIRVNAEMQVAWKKKSFEAGDKAICLNNNGYPRLKQGQEYTIDAYEEGIFADSPFVQVFDYVCHANRFISERDLNNHE